jgi:hypothetical protein
MTLPLLIIAAMVLFREWTHLQTDKNKDKLINDLAEKLMAKDFTEYKEQTQPPRTFDPVAQTDETQYWQEVEESKR